MCGPIGCWFWRIPSAFSDRQTPLHRHGRRIGCCPSCPAWMPHAGATRRARLVPVLREIMFKWPPCVAEPSDAMTLEVASFAANAAVRDFSGRLHVIVELLLRVGDLGLWSSLNVVGFGIRERARPSLATRFWVSIDGERVILVHHHPAERSRPRPNSVPVFLFTVSRVWQLVRDGRLPLSRLVTAAASISGLLRLDECAWRRLPAGCAGRPGAGGGMIVFFVRDGAWVLLQLCR